MYTYVMYIHANILFSVLKFYISFNSKYFINKGKSSKTNFATLVTPAFAINFLLLPYKWTVF